MCVVLPEKTIIFPNVYQIPKEFNHRYLQLSNNWNWFKIWMSFRFSSFNMTNHHHIYVLLYVVYFNMERCEIIPFVFSCYNHIFAHSLSSQNICSEINHINWLYVVVDVVCAATDKQQKKWELNSASKGKANEDKITQWL